MARKKDTTPKQPQRQEQGNAVIANAGVVITQPITETLEKNYMPYAMSVIVSRAIPEIDGFKPSHRKLLYTMYKMGLLTGQRTKSANIVGQTMRLNPHGDAAIYETMVRLARGNEALLHAYIDSKGNFGKAYSRDMACAASRYTEAKLDPICLLLFDEIDSDTVDFNDNYDGTMKEPALLPAKFPSVLVNANIGIAVGMASSICSFNLKEVCDTAAALLKNPEHDLSSTLLAPDFPGGGFVVYNEDELKKIYDTGRGGVKVRARYSHDKANGCIDITEIPPTTTVEAIIDKIVDLVKQNKIKEIADIRDETDLKGLKITVDLRRGADADKLMQRLYRLTPLEDSFSCNFNVLVGGSPRVMGARELITEWAAFRRECVKRRVFFEKNKKQEKLHLLLGLKRILLDIDKAVKIVRETDEEREVVPNLMIGFGIDEIQAEFVAEIRLRHLNREYILKRTAEVDSLKAEIAEMKEILENPKKVTGIITEQLKEIAKKFGKPRRSEIYYPTEDDTDKEPEEDIADYPCTFFFTAEGYFKKITPQSLRMSGEHKLKEGDRITREVSSGNAAHLLFFSDRGQVYKAEASEFPDTKASVMGEYIPARLGFDEGENVIYMAVTTRDYNGWMLFFFENGKAAKVELGCYKTVTKRRKLKAAYYEGSGLVSMYHAEADGEYLLKSTAGKCLIVNTGLISPKTTKNTQGVAAMTLRKSAALVSATPFTEDMLLNSHRFRSRNIPAAGQTPREDDKGEQLSF